MTINIYRHRLNRVVVFGGTVKNKKQYKNIAHCLRVSKHERSVKVDWALSAIKFFIEQF